MILSALDMEMHPIELISRKADAIDRCSDLPFSFILTAFNGRYDVASRFHNQPFRSQKLLNGKQKESEEDEVSNKPPIYLDCVEKILLRLPLPSLLRAKSVCKEWNATICHPVFPSLYDSLNSNPSTCSHYLVAQHKNQGSHGIVLFSPSLDRWFQIPLQLPWRPNCPLPPHSVALCAAGGGLLLFVDTNYRKVIVLNPLTNQHRVLPYFPQYNRNWYVNMAVELIANPSSNHFEVIAIASSVLEPSNLRALVYNSSRDTWRTKKATEPRSWRRKRRSVHGWRSTVHNGVLYCTNTYGFRMCCYDIDSGKFTFVEVEGGLPPLVDYLDCDKNLHAGLPSLVVCSGRLILAGRLHRSDESNSSILGRLPLVKHNLVGVWALDLRAESKSWSLISVSPKHLLEDIVKSSDGTDFLVVASDGKDRIWFMLRGSIYLLGFSMSSMEWSLFPGGPGEDIMDTRQRRAFSMPLGISRSPPSWGL